MTLGLPLVDHVWQSTLFAVFVWLATMALRSNGARVRFWLWTAASIKFLVPLSMLVNLGERFKWRAAPAVMQPAVSFVMEDVLAPADVVVAVPAAIPHAPIAWPWIVLAVWCAGALVMLLSWWRQWLPIRAALLRARTVQLDARYGAADLAVMSSPVMPEPGVVGIRRQRLLLPEGLVERLSPEQLRALIAHERCHIRCYDNLTAAIHMAVETIFWFHPVVWWIERRLIDERERACDESVLASGGRPQDYAEGILEVCRESVGLRLACVAGVSGANLRARVEAIMRNEIGRPMTRGRRWALALMAAATVLGPIAGGALRAQSQIVVPRSGFAFAETSLKRHAGVGTPLMYFSGDADGRPGVGPDGRFELVVATNVTARGLLRFAFPGDGRANIGPGGFIEIANSPGWIDADRFDLVAKAPSRVTQPQLREMLQSALIERFKLKAHRGSTEIPIYALSVAQQGGLPAGLTPSQLDCQSNAGQPSPWPCGIISATPNRLIGRGVTMAAFAGALAQLLDASSQIRVDRPLVDRTGLSGTFDFALEWRPDPVTRDVLSPSRRAAGLPNLPYVSLLNAANFLAALEQQLGLAFVPGSAAQPALIVDEIELPTLD